MKIEELHDLFDREQTKEIAFEGKCHDCKREIIVLAEAERTGFKITGGAVYKVYDAELYKGKDRFSVKCNDCYEKERLLTGYQECEIYSRIVGYLRPVSQWNVGKQQEFRDRKMFDTKVRI